MNRPTDISLKGKEDFLRISSRYDRIEIRSSYHSLRTWKEHCSTWWRVEPMATCRPSRNWRTWIDVWNSTRRGWAPPISWRFSESRWILRISEPTCTSIRKSMIGWWWCGWTEHERSSWRKFLLRWAPWCRDKGIRPRTVRRMNILRFWNPDFSMMPWKSSIYVSTCSPPKSWGRTSWKTRQHPEVGTQGLPSTYETSIPQQGKGGGSVPSEHSMKSNRSSLGIATYSSGRIFHASKSLPIISLLRHPPISGCLLFSENLNLSRVFVWITWKDQFSLSVFSFLRGHSRFIYNSGVTGMVFRWQKIKKFPTKTEENDVIGILQECFRFPSTYYNDIILIPQKKIKSCMPPFFS